MPEIGTGMISGIYDFWVARRSQLGYAMGTSRTPDNPTVGTVYAPHRSRAVISFSSGSPAYELAQERGGQTLGPQRDLGPTSWGAPSITLSRFDEILDGILGDYTPDTTTISNAVITARNSQRSKTVPLVVGIVVGFDSEVDVENYATIVYPNCSIRPAKPGSSQTGGTNPNPLALQLVVSPSENTGVGPNFAGLALNIQEGKDTDFIIRGRYPYIPITFVDDGTLTTFDTPWLPVSSDAVGGVTNLVNKNGIPAVFTSVSVTTGVVVKPVGAALSVWSFLMQTQFETV